MKIKLKNDPVNCDNFFYVWSQATKFAFSVNVAFIPSVSGAL